ncbi:MAG: DUF1800 family protein [Acidobacteriota bacterium]
MTIGIRAVLNAGTFLMMALPALAAGNGLRGDYFNNTGLAGSPVAVRIDPTVNFSWNAAPVVGLSNNYFSVRWTGKLEAPVTGAYQLATDSNEGIRVWLNNNLVIDHWTSHALQKDTSAAVQLTAGQQYYLKIEFYDGSGTAVSKLQWSYPGQTETVIPQARLYSDASVSSLPEPVYLSSLTPVLSLNGWGPYEKDLSNGEARARDGQGIKIDGVRYARGLGVHAASDVRYQLLGKYKTFFADLGIDDEVTNHGSVLFEVWVDGVRKFASEMLDGTRHIVPIIVDVTGKNELRLVVLGGDDISYDHADWAGARVVDATGASTPPPVPIPTVPSVPTELSATAGNAKVTLSWAAASGASSYKLYRSTTSGGQAEPPTTVGVTGLSLIDTGVTNGTMYYYKVAAVNATGSSGMSAQAGAQPVAPPAAPAAPTGLTATPGNTQVTLAWTAVPEATSYNLYRATVSGGQGDTPVMTGISGPGFIDTGLTNNTTYYYKVAAVNANGISLKSGQASAKPVPPPPPAVPTGLTAAPGNTLVTLSWTAVTGATAYNLYRSTVSGGQGDVPVMTGIASPAFVDTGLTNNTTYYYKVAAVNANGSSTLSNQASAKPVPPPPPAAPTGLTATPGDKRVTLSWNTVTGAASYNVYRGTRTNTQAPTPLATTITGATWMDTPVENSATYFYKVAAVNEFGTSTKSNEASATPTAPPVILSSEQKAAFRFLRQATWGPTPALMDHVVQVGKAAFLEEQFALPATDYPQTLVDMPNMELVSERFFQNALQGPDQLRQRVAWALSQIFVASAIKVDNTHAMVPYIRILEDGAFGNVRDLLTKVTLSPAMGEFLDMVNNKKANPETGTMPNENYPRELMQLFTLGLVNLNPDGSPTTAPAYTQADILEMARILSGWTYGDTVAGDPTRINQPFYDGPMEPVSRYHDLGAKTLFSGTPFVSNFPANQTPRADLDQALNALFNHPNIGPFLVKQLIQRLVKSSPSATYIGDVVAVFNNNGQGVRGDLKAVVQAILLHAEASATPNSGKFSEPALFLLTFARGLNSTVVDHPYLTDFSQDMGQRIWFAPSVFNYFSPGYRLNGVLGPELQIWSTATAMTRTNFVAALVSGGFGTDFKIDTTPYLGVAGNPQSLVDTADSLVMGGAMGAEMRQSILTALASSTGNTDRIRTVLYLIGSSMQYQVEH